MSYTKLLYHAIFCTKYRKNTIPEQHEKELYAYILGIITAPSYFVRCFKEHYNESPIEYLKRVRKQ